MNTALVGGALLVGAYLLGSVPSAYLAGRLVRGIDLRTVGSGNLGASNVYRELGLAPALVVLVADMAKGALAAGAGLQVMPQAAGVAGGWWALAIGGAAIAGHSRSVFLKWRGGGKGVATAAGMFLVLAPAALGGAFVVFALGVAVTRIVSVGSMLGALALPAFVWRLLGMDPTFYASIAVAVFVVYTHRTNIARLIAGTEPRLGRNGGKPA